MGAKVIGNFQLTTFRKDISKILSFLGASFIQMIVGETKWVPGRSMYLISFYADLA